MEEHERILRLAQEITPSSIPSTTNLDDLLQIYSFDQLDNIKPKTTLMWLMRDTSNQQFSKNVSSRLLVGLLSPAVGRPDARLFGFSFYPVDEMDEATHRFFGKGYATNTDRLDTLSFSEYEITGRPTQPLYQPKQLFLYQNDSFCELIK